MQIKGRYVFRGEEIDLLEVRGGKSKTTHDQKATSLLSGDEYESTLRFAPWVIVSDDHVMWDHQTL